MKTKPLIIELSSSENTPIQSQSSYQQPTLTKNLRTMTYPCVVCRKKCSYRCPKCNKNYCSIEHYRSHNLFCSQGFFEKQVKQGLKNTKVTDIQSKKKVVEMVKECWRQQQEEELGINEERLEEILAAIQTGKEVQLSEKQQILFDRYVKQLTGQNHKDTNNEDEQNIIFNKPYWQIPQGLSIYLTDTPQIEQLEQSSYPQLLTHRTLLKSQLQQFLQQHPPPSIQSQINPTLLKHLGQLIYLYIVLYRAYDGESQVFINDLVSIYCSKEYDALLKVDAIEVGVSLQIIRTKLRGAGEAVWAWAWEYSQIVVQDLKKVLNNRLLIIQTLLRIMQLLIIHSPQNTSQLSHSKTNPDTKKLKKVLKKCEYLLYATYYKTNNQSYKQLLEQMTSYLLKTSKKQQQKTEPRLLAAKMQLNKVQLK